MQAGLAGDRTAFPSEIRFTKGGEGWSRPQPEAPFTDDDTGHSSQVSIRSLHPGPRGRGSAGKESCHSNGLHRVGDKGLLS